MGETNRKYFGGSIEQEGTDGRMNDCEQYHEYHKADVELKLFLDSCDDPNYDEQQPSLLMLIAVFAFVVAAELTLVFYFLGESLGTASALYASITAIVFIVCSAMGVSFCHANTSTNLSIGRRGTAVLGMILFLGIFLYSVGILSSWRADSVSSGFEAVIAGYRAMGEVPVFATALVNLFGFALLAYEARIFFWARYWGYRRTKERYDAAKALVEGISNGPGDEDLSNAG